MRVLVSGDRGYIGAVLVPRLLKAGHDVVGLDAGWYDGGDFGHFTTAYESRTGDVRDATADDLKGFDAVIHLAAISNDPVGHLIADATYSVNVDGTLDLARAAKAAGVGRFLFSSSCSLYGSAGLEPVTEDSAFNPVTPYGESKVLAEAGLAEMADQDFSPVYLRNATAYGSSPRWRADIVVNSLCGYAFTTGAVRLESDGSPWRPLVHVDDISTAFLAALEGPRDVVHNQAFNVGRDEDVVQIKTIAEWVAQEFHVPVTLADGAGPDKRDYRVSFEKIRASLPSYVPRWTILDGIRELAGDMSTRGLSLADFQGERFVRLARVRALMEAGRLDGQLRQQVALEAI